MSLCPSRIITAGEASPKLTSPGLPTFPRLLKLRPYFYTYGKRTSPTMSLLFIYFLHENNIFPPEMKISFNDYLFDK